MEAVRDGRYSLRDIHNERQQCIFANSMYLDDVSNGQISAEMLPITSVTRERTQASGRHGGGGGGGGDGVTLAMTNGLVPIQPKNNSDC